MSTVLKQLGQVQPGVTTPVTIYSPPTAASGVVKSLLVCNTTASAVLASVYHDVLGATFNAATAIVYRQSIPANSSVVLSFFVALGSATDVLAVQAATITALTFTVYGAEQV